MQLIPTTVKGQSYYIIAILLMVIVMFTQNYGWYDWTKLIGKKTDEA